MGNNRKIKEILSKVLTLQTIPEDISPSNCGNWDSLRHLFLVIELESAYGISIEPEEIAKMKSIKDIETIISAKSEKIVDKEV